VLGNGNINGVSFYASSYLGGSGDDIPSSVLIQNSIYYIAARPRRRTSAGQRILLNRGGSSDAFLVKVNLLSSGALNIAASTLFGGADGSRRAARGRTQPVHPDGGRDLFLRSAADQRCARHVRGGASDAFVAQFTRISRR